jgi:glycerate 2-kinase
MNPDQTRKNALEIFKAGVDAVDPIKLINKFVCLKGHSINIKGSNFDLSSYENIYILGIGKAAAAMAKPLEKILGDHLTGGIIIVKYGHTLPLKKVRIIEAGHPVPDEAGYRGAQECARILQRSGSKDLIFFLISGGGSALFPYPVKGLTLEDKQKTTTVLLEAGAGIQEINTLRKHLSRVKGGQSAQLAYPATLITLILSDVIGDELDSIASGPTVPDPSTFTDCMNIVEKYSIKDKLPSGVAAIFNKGIHGEIKETPKPGNQIFKKTHNIIIGNNLLALRAARKKAEKLGYNTLLLSTFIQGETRDAAKVHAAIAKEILASGNPINPPACVLSGGETTVTIRGKGKGGRNQEFALAAAMEIAGEKNITILSGGTDGTDGPTDAAGAVADGTTVTRALNMEMDPAHYLKTNDSYHFFKRLNDLIITGPTYTNVMDLRIILVV